MTPMELRMLAADLIEVNGWTRLRDERDGRFCMLGALLHVAPKLDGQLAPEYNEAVANLRRELGVFYLTHWNDHVAPSRKRVIAALRGQS